MGTKAMLKKSRSIKRTFSSMHGQCQVLKCDNRIKALNLLCDTSYLGHFALDIAIDGNLTMASPNLAFERCQAKISSNEVKVSNQSLCIKCTEILIIPNMSLFSSTMF